MKISFQSFVIKARKQSSKEKINWENVDPPGRGRNLKGLNRLQHVRLWNKVCDYLKVMKPNWLDGNFTCCFNHFMQLCLVTVSYSCIFIYFRLRLQWFQTTNYRNDKNEVYDLICAIRWTHKPNFVFVVLFFTNNKQSLKMPRTCIAINLHMQAYSTSSHSLTSKPCWGFAKRHWHKGTHRDSFAISCAPGLHINCICRSMLCQLRLYFAAFVLFIPTFIRLCCRTVEQWLRLSLNEPEQCATNISKTLNSCVGNHSAAWIFEVPCARQKFSLLHTGGDIWGQSWWYGDGYV